MDQESYSNPKQFKMNASDLYKIQEITQGALNEEFTQEYLMNELYQANVGKYFKALNKKILANFGMDICE